MGLAQRLVRGTQLDSGGPRSKNVLKSWARTPLQIDRFDQVFSALLEKGELVKYSDRRQAVYGPPWLTRRRGLWVERNSPKVKSNRGGTMRR